MKTKVSSLAIAASESISTTAPPGKVPATHTVPSGLYRITWGAPCTITFTYPCSSQAISFESQGSLDVEIFDQHSISADTALHVRRVGINATEAGYEVSTLDTGLVVGTIGKG